ncbi:MAG: ABC transporter ATP-binding protein [Spirochaetales bacterium]|jgi:oligopeptide/dipeptide ABC transporter ATP-binding protein|nr:ABC transporter ATP-binding protein [Spirochaetales bacterium]
MPEPLLEVENLRVLFEGESGTSVGVSDVSFTLREGVNLALIGESGSGKSVTSLSCMGLLGRNAGISRGRVVFRGQDITGAPEKQMRAIRGKLISMIFQEPMTSLNPVLSIGFQLGEPLRLHTALKASRIRERSRELLEQVGIAGAEKVLRGYPHELSGGMRQRVMIAMALACSPRLLIADEPTTALDVTIQAQILTLLKRLQEETGITILIVTHDFGVVAEMAGEVVVMYAGLAMESGKVEEIFEHPLHPYTEGLLKSIIPLDASEKTSLHSIPGVVSPISLEQKGCSFHERCPYAAGKCRSEQPALREKHPGHFVRCFLDAGL